MHRQIRKAIKTRGHFPETPYIEVLGQIRGIGRYIAMLVIAEVGDISPFPSARHLCAWAGLTPTVRSSDGRVAWFRDPDGNTFAIEEGTTR